MPYGMLTALLLSFELVQQETNIQDGLFSKCGCVAICTFQAVLLISMLREQVSQHTMASSSSISSFPMMNSPPQRQP